MLEIGWGKIVLIGIVALLVIGPKELPAVLRTVGQWMTKLRRMAGEFQSQFQEAMREAEMADLKKQVDDMTSQAQSYANFDPIGEVRKEFDSTQQQIESALAKDPAAPTSEPATPQLPDPSAPVSSEPPLAPSTGAEPNAPSATVEPAGVGTDAGKPDAGDKPA
jgi:sec-independent protein translocase protein TatB